MGVADPDGGIAMIAQGVTRVRMEKYIQHAVVQRQPFDNAAEVFAVERELIRPQRMGTYGAFMETAYLRDGTEAYRDDFPERPRRIAA